MLNIIKIYTGGLTLQLPNRPAAHRRGSQPVFRKLRQQPPRRAPALCTFRRGTADTGGCVGTNGLQGELVGDEKWRLQKQKNTLRFQDIMSRKYDEDWT